MQNALSCFGQPPASSDNTEMLPATRAQGGSKRENKRKIFPYQLCLGAAVCVSYSHSLGASTIHMMTEVFHKRRNAT
ncbi:hypothetical protein Y032_0194g1426 [Ancylostoma ceylanicum]|uniref:Uncharacterized protein n=1 Tax=Ancylostoma ceylanicum TaxID=53326 RepID=A0A016SPW6_9BILA|nr:hypothetical protein Y032_0194g1426 [Ancylostoma ceylanicum]